MPHSLQNSKGNFINGRWTQGNGAPFTSLNPAYGTPLWSGHEASLEDCEKAIAAARAALEGWSTKTLEERESYLQHYKTALQKQKEELALRISQENGKPLWEARMEVDAMLLKVDLSIQAQKERCPTKQQARGNQILHTRHKPHGVVAVLGPFNFPAHLPNGHIVPALLAGNTVLFKPSEETPGVAELMVEIWESTKLPPGVLNLLQGGPFVGRTLSFHPDIDGLFFTGSSHTGSFLQEANLKTPHKILALEMGGNNPLVIGNIQDPDAAAYQTILSSYITSGQRCTCARRLILCETKNSTAFLKRLIERIKTIRIGPYDSSPEPFMGPLIHNKAAEHALLGEKALVELGAKSLVPLQRPKNLSPAFLSPGLLDCTDIASKLPDEEIFGPLLKLIRVKTLEEAIKAANNTSYGLSAGIFTSDKQEYDTFYKRTRAGVINWNVQLTGASSAAPFGGIGKSGNYRPSAFYAADYCNYPVASSETPELELPNTPLPGLI